MAPRVVGNDPGLQNAGLMWAEVFTRFVKGFGFTQSIVDWRLFYMFDEEDRALQLGTPDCKFVVQSGPLVARFSERRSSATRPTPTPPQGASWGPSTTGCRPACSRSAAARFWAT